MKIADALRTVRMLFLDSAPVIYFVERHPKYVVLVDDIFARFDQGQLAAAASPVTLAECLVHPCKAGNQKAQNDFDDLLVAGSAVQFQAIGAAEAARAADFRARYNLSLADALQVATAIAAGCDALLTNDQAFKKVTEIPILILDDLEP